MSTPLVPGGQDLDDDHRIDGGNRIVRDRRAAVDDGVGLVVGVRVDLDRHAVGQSLAVAAMVPERAIKGLPDAGLDAGVDGALRRHGDRFAVHALVARTLLLFRPLPELVPPHPVLPRVFHHRPRNELQHGSTPTALARNHSLWRQRRANGTLPVRMHLQEEVRGASWQPSSPSRASRRWVRPWHGRSRVRRL